MRPISSWLILAFAATAVGCASPPVVPQKESENYVVDSLANAANGVMSELRNLNEITGRTDTQFVTDVKGCAAKKVTYNFDGDVMSFISDLKESGICQLRVVGKKPQQDLTLSLHYGTKTPLWQILENASIQLGKMGTITVGRELVVVQLNGGIQQ